MKRVFGFIAAGILAAGLGVGLAQPAAATSNPVTPPSGELKVPAAPKVPGDRPVGVRAPKGLPDNSSNSVSALSTVYFRYAGARQYLNAGAGESASAAAANLHIAPSNYLDTARGDFHTLGEVALQSDNQQNTVEVGWTKDPSVCGAGNKACLFVYWWKNGVPQCYNGCGFVDYAPEPVNAGADITADAVSGGIYTPRRFTIQYSAGNWWVSYNGKWVGYYPDTLWSAAVPSGPGVTFVNGTKIQIFYEAATSVDKTCTDLGNGQAISSGTAARVGSMSLGGKVPSTIVDNFAGFNAPDTTSVPSWPTTVLGNTNLSTLTVRAGGPGWNSAGTAAGTAGAC